MLNIKRIKTQFLKYQACSTKPVVYFVPYSTKYTSSIFIIFLLPISSQFQPSQSHSNSSNISHWPTSEPALNPRPQTHQNCDNYRSTIGCSDFRRWLFLKAWMWCGKEGFLGWIGICRGLVIVRVWTSLRDVFGCLIISKRGNLSARLSLICSTTRTTL